MHCKARSSTPRIMLGPVESPNSPPQSPTSTSPHPMLRGKYAARHLPPYHNLPRPMLLEETGIQPIGNGHQFSFTPSNRFAQLSPRTSSEESGDEEESESESEPYQKQMPQARPKAVDEDDDSDEEEEGDEHSEEDGDEDEDDIDMMPPSAPLPACMRVPTAAPITTSMHPHMGMDSRSEEDEEDEDEEDEDEREEDDEDEEEDDEEENDEDEEEDGEESSTESGSSDSDSDPEVLPHAPELPRQSRPIAVSTAPPTSSPKAGFTVEEMSDFDPMDQDRTGTIAPSGFSSPASARSRSRAPAPILPPTELPHGLTRDMRNLNCSASDSDSSDDLDAEAAAHQEFIRKQRELRKLKRRSHGSSIGKRTVSERSDSDHEDWTPLDADAMGSSARRLRRRVGDPSVRRSFIQLQFQDPPPERIDEVDEPESEVEGVYYCDHETLAKELPYWMEYESPSP